ncbi:MULTISPECIES: hypothetical protein [Metallosphaera]|uniref:hypothetical protein n=1 Tax=Metallosphaera TaxID=41980 RepID=UPI0000E8EB59|nr:MULTISPECIES: hypothetical protein [Metallosphaera]MCH1770587.1 hypothetical protein [Metallosphaera sedula]MCP6728785.1 hypothetical protein [Metallosphaera sedula]MCY0861063.1 hypothetical protein [Metallosphaera prunae]WPX06097.1 hypothetical protein SOJ17_002155 [Metallosphaera sedula DSM 5348]BBL48290.1 isopentenyl-diphosphate synthesis related conserved protein [Metallosphaera sedula]
MPQDSVIEAPLILSGMWIDGVNNPFLVVQAKFRFSRIETPSWWDQFSELVKEATGFTPPVVQGVDIPVASQYAITSLEALRILGKRISLTEDEIWETLEMVDEAMFNYYALKAMRQVQRSGTPILYREAEDPVQVRIPILTVRKLMSYPLEKPSYLDNSVVHLVGIIPVLLSERIDEVNMNLENGLWKSLYGLNTPPGKYKWVWDLGWASLIELLN